jgi:hypothetical protein
MEILVVLHQQVDHHIKQVRVVVELAVPVQMVIEWI